MEQVEGSVLGWLRERHPVLAERGSVTALLKGCIERKICVDVRLFEDLAEALDHLERVQSGLTA
jgi:hypothetical protein